MRAVLLLLGFVASCYAHSLILCVDWDGKTQKCNEDALPYHENFDGSFAYYHKQEGPLCTPESGVGQALLTRADSKASAPYEVQAGSEVTLVWPANNHALINSPDNPGVANQDVFLYHSYTNDPDDALFSTTPLVSFYFGNCYEGGSFDLLDSGSFGNPYCTGTFTIPEDWTEGVHTLVWAWKMNYSTQLTRDGRMGGDVWAQNENSASNKDGPHINYLTCFQYNVINPNGGTIKATRTQPELDFSPTLHDVVQLDDEIKNAGGQGRSYSAEAPQATAAAPKASTNPKSNSVKKVADSDSQALVQDDDTAEKSESTDTQPDQGQNVVVVTVTQGVTPTGRSGYRQWSGNGYNRHQDVSQETSAAEKEVPVEENSYAAGGGLQGMQLSGNGQLSMAVGLLLGALGVYAVAL